MIEKNSVLGGRYEVLNPNEFDKENRKNKNGIDRFYYFKDIVNRPYARVQLNLGRDKRLNRVVIIKSSKYRECDYENEVTIEHRRSAINAQIDLLNDLKSPLLPEPIDYIEIATNNNRIPYSLRSKEPILVLDYQSGKTLQYMIDKLVKDNKKTGIIREIHRIREICRICKNIVTFLKVLKEEGYAYQALNLKHILLLKDNSIRFLGLGSICKTKEDGKLDSNHRNFGVTTLGYSAPELNNKSLLDWGADYATSESIGAFSLGVILHQLVIGRDLKYEIDSDIIGEHGQLVYPNDKTENLVKASFAGNKLHRLITDLCKEDSFARLTDYDEIIARLENIFDNKKLPVNRYDKLQNISMFNLLYSEEDNKHCIFDNEVLQEIEVLVDYYTKGTTNLVGSIPSKAYVCNVCKGLNKYYIDTVSYAELQFKLDEIMKDSEQELEFKAIDNDYNLNIIDDVIINNKESNRCMIHNSRLQTRKVSLAYYRKGQLDNQKGRLNLELSVCPVCQKVHIDENKLKIIRGTLESKLNENCYDFKVLDVKYILPKVSKLTMLDKSFNNCVNDLEKLQSTYVSLPYREDNKTKLLMINLKYCRKCKKYYIDQNGLIDINKNIPSQSKRLFEIEKLNSTVSHVISIYDKEKLCLEDSTPLTRKSIAINWYKDSTCKEIIGKIKIGAWICNCKKVYIKEEIDARLTKLVEEKSGYVDIRKPQRPIIETLRIITKETETCKKKHKLLNGIVNIKYINTIDESINNLEYLNQVNYCNECSEAYLTEDEYNYVSSLLDENCCINKKKNLKDVIFGEIFRNIFK